MTKKSKKSYRVVRTDRTTRLDLLSFPDLKDRLLDSEAEVEELKDKLKKAEKEIESLSDTNKSLVDIRKQLTGDLVRAQMGYTRIHGRAARLGEMLASSDDVMFNGAYDTNKFLYDIRKDLEREFETRDLIFSFEFPELCGLKRELLGGDNVTLLPPFKQ